MSYLRALAAINLEKTDRVPHFETIDNPGFIKKVSGIDPYRFPFEAYHEAYRRIDLDISPLPIPNISVKFEGEDVKRAEGGGEITEWGVRGSYWRDHKKWFTSTEDVFLFDPLKNVEKLPQLQSIVEIIQEYKKAHESIKDCTFFPAWNQWTLFEWGLETFGMELFLLAAMEAPSKFDKILEGFMLLSLRNCEEWAKENIKLIITHDDLACTGGPIFPPDWYRKYIFPRYKRLWKPLKEKGIKIVYCSDGDFTPLIDDIVNAGADGFMIEPCINLEHFARTYPDKIIIGNFDTRVLLKGDEREIEDEVRRCLKAGGKCPGYFLYVSNQIAQDIPVEKIELYFELSLKYGKR